MTVSTTQSSSVMLGNGVTTSFSFSFNNAVPSGQSTSEASYTVIYTDTAGVETTLAASTYTLSFTAASAGTLWGVGGTLTYPTSGSPIASGTTLTLIRTFPLTQTTTISNQGDFSPQVIEEMGDTLEMQIQQVNNRTTQWKGVWLSGAVYNPGDIVQDGSNGANTNNWYICLIGNTSGTWSTDLANGDWTLSVPATGPTTNLPITLSGAVTGTGAQAITTTFGQVSAASFLGNMATGSATVTAISLSVSTLAGRGASASGGGAAIALGTGLSMAGTTLNGGIVIVKHQTFTSSATYTPSIGMICCDVQLWGAGGGGGGVSAVNGAAGAGGGAGGFSRKLFATATIGTGVAVVIGAGGGGGSNSGGAGSNGATCTFANVLICSGGGGGNGSSSAAVGVQGGTGGSASGGSLNYAGEGGFCSIMSNLSAANTSGAGGCTLLGGSGRGLLASSAAAANASSNSGSGGGGAGSSGSGLAGGNGGSGFCLVTEYCSQ